MQEIKNLNTVEGGPGVVGGDYPCDAFMPASMAGIAK